MTSITLHPGDNRITLRKMIADGIRVHSVVTDPPYGLVSVQKRFGKADCAPARKEGNDGSFTRLSGGFMGKTWDGTEIERDPEFWKLIHDVLLPGGFVFAFSGSRTGHWQACAMETAGLIMHPMHGWVFGTGFPKGHAIDRPLLKMEHPDSEKWTGYAHGTQTQKPALEPIYLGQRPFSEKTGVANVLKHGVGAFNVDACRIPIREGDDVVAKNPNTRGGFGHANAEVYGKSDGAPTYDLSKGRYPSNLILDGAAEVAAMFPNGAERFFHQFPPDAVPLYYSGKAGKADRAGSNHPTVKPIALMQYLIRHITPAGGTVLDPFAGTGTTAVAARNEGFDCILMEAEDEYVDFLKERFPDDISPTNRRRIPDSSARVRRVVPGMTQPRRKVPV